MQFQIDKMHAVDEKILSDLEIIKSLLLKNVPGVYSLILVGGFGRGEGGVLFENGVPKPINDYDIVIISKYRLYRSRRKKLSKEIAKELGIRLVDLIPIERTHLSKLPYTMFNYDLKYGGHIFFGDKNILGGMPDFNPSRMPLLEGKILLFNRMICLLESYSAEFTKRSPTEDEKFFLTNQSSKAILACCDALLLSKGLYHYSYNERCSRFSETFKVKKKITGLVEQATDFKLRPTRKMNFDAVNYWIDVREEFVNTLKSFLELFYKRHFRDWKDFSEFYKSQETSLMKKVINTLRRKPITTKGNIELSEIFLLNAIGGESLNDTYMNHARLNIEEVCGKTLESDVDWEYLRKECVRLWFEYLH